MPDGRGGPPTRAAPVARGRGEMPGHGSLAQIQRTRMLDAMVRAACEYGAANVTVAHVTRRAGVSRRTFYELFDDSQDCLLAAIDEALARARQRVSPVYHGVQGGWRAQVRAGLVALLGFLDEHPDTARLLIVEWLATGPRGLAGRQRTLERVARVLDDGHAARRVDGSISPELLAESTIGGVVSVLHNRLSGERGGALLELTNPLMGLIVLPYLGVAAARGELERPVPATTVNGRRESDLENPFKDLDMRLTYRTTRVLAAVATHPGGSNRKIAEAADIGDQGQISKLLRRLCGLGLLENTGAGSLMRGEPNAWVLSARGMRLEQALRVEQVAQRAPTL